MNNTTLKQALEASAYAERILKSIHQYADNLALNTTVRSDGSLEPEQADKLMSCMDMIVSSTGDLITKMGTVCNALDKEIG